MATIGFGLMAGCWLGFREPGYFKGFVVELFSSFCLVFPLDPFPFSCDLPPLLRYDSLHLLFSHPDVLTADDVVLAGLTVLYDIAP